jgi:hypothetical protein
MNTREDTMNRNHTPANHPLALRHFGMLPKDPIEWEEMPSLAPRMVPMQAQTEPMLRAQAAEFNTAWGVTMPAHLDMTPQPAPFRETIRGLVTREMNEPDLFKQFFG